MIIYHAFSRTYPQDQSPGNIFVWPNSGAGGATPVEVVAPATGSGWERKRLGPLPQYYRDIKIPDYRLIALPQDETANAVAIDVLDKIGEIWSRLQESDRHFAAMLKQLDTIGRQVATFIESRQIYQLVELVETRIRIEQDHAKALADARDDEEHEEFMHLF